MVQFTVPGVVPKPKSKVAQNREVLGQEHHNGGVRSVRCDGATLFAATRDHTEERQGERVGRAVAAR